MSAITPATWSELVAFCRRFIAGGLRFTGRWPETGDPMSRPSRSTNLPVSQLQARGVRDLTIRLIGIPFFGLLIPRVMGVLDSLDWRDPAYWFGTVLFLALSFALWQGNRWLLFRRRARADWLSEPGRTLLGLLLAHVLYSTALTVAALLLWYRGTSAFTPWAQLGAVALVVVTAVLLVTHAYETTFLIQDRLEDRLRVEQIERARLQAQLGVMKSELTPHFLFNCLNSLGILIREDPDSARRYNQHMAEVCRYLIVQQRRDLVTLEEELAFFDAYAALARLRFGDGLRIVVSGFDPASLRDLMIPPASLQLLLENALKHNVFTAREPLVISVQREGAAIAVSNLKRGAAEHSHSTGTGLANLRDRFQLITGRQVEVADTGSSFAVKLPLVAKVRE